jgi:putative MATE family efflux protein
VTGSERPGPPRSRLRSRLGTRLQSPWDREIARLAIPAFGALIAEPLYVLADTAIVGHLGTDQLAGLAVASSVLLTGYAVFIFLAYGTTAAVARLIGAGEEREAAHQAVQSIWLALAIAAVLVPAGVLGAGRLVRALGATGAAAGYAETYLRISMLGVPALLVTLAAIGYLRGRQDTRTPLLVSIGAAAVNLVLELVLIYGLGYGVGASAASTVFAQTGAAAIYLALVARQTRSHGVSLRPAARAVGRLARVGVDLLIRTAALRLTLLAATAVAARLGAVEVAAHQIALELWNSLAIALDAIAIAAQAMVGRLLGAGDAAGARSASRRMVEIGLAFGVLAGIGVLALRGVLPHAFTDDPAVLALSSFLLIYVAVMQPVNAVVFVLDGVLMGAGDMRFLAVAMVGAAALFGLAAVVLLVTGAGIGWLWAAFGGFMLARLGALGTRAVGDRWAVVGAVR